MDGAGTRASPAAPKWLPEERPGAGEGQKAKRRAAIAREEGGGARCCPHTLTHTHSHSSSSCHTPSVPLSSSFSFVVLQHRNLTPLIREDRLCDAWIKEGKERRNMLSHCHRKKKNTTVLTFPCAHTEPLWRENKLRNRREH